MATYMTLKQAAEYTGFAPKTFYNWRYAQPNRLPPHQVLKSGKYETLRFKMEDLDKWMAQQSAR